MTPHLTALLGPRRGIPSICSAHPMVIEAALRLGLEHEAPVLIEATCNQVNHQGGYTGLQPQDFRDFVHDIARRVGFPAGRIILGGDHLGPNPWRHLPADDAMIEARRMVEAYARAGFRKLHLDCSMGCAGEPAALSDELTAARAAELAAIAEAAAPGDAPPLYVIGTEVPVPGGARAALHAEPTSADAVRRTHEIHRAAFLGRNLGAAFARVIALVVQPGVEFGDGEIIAYEPSGARALVAAREALGGPVYEAHSTDYQSAAALSALARDGFAILKVGPWLTHALREALYGLDAIADVLEGAPPRQRLMRQMESLMLAAPEHWQNYHQGAAAERFLSRHFSYSDRIRYYWTRPEARAAVEALLQRLEGRAISPPLQQQYLGQIAGPQPAEARDLLLRGVQAVLRRYEDACA